MTEKTKHNQEIKTEANIIPNVTEANMIPNVVKLENGQDIGKNDDGKCDEINTCSTQNMDNSCEACDAVKLLGRPSGVKRCVFCGKDWRMFKKREE